MTTSYLVVRSDVGKVDEGVDSERHPETATFPGT